ncbi:SERTA domain-containing protein 2 [Triplophysa tibetana]|uniref:SERTA domain-containing protein 2 n=1 Tax=Triplophysa tibetana TaxID=1572043 RepID=A0A5A9PM57_9TELE|nr:SERTA domain-containing protein 2 [Triplophysa tibetana]
MLGKGLKRKLEQEEENERKKMDPHQEVMPTFYCLQRQTVLTLSLSKLHSQPAHSDPGLVRRVLITNTLRHIQEELRVEAVLLPQSLATDIKDSFTSALAEIEDLCPAVEITSSLTNSHKFRQTEPVHESMESNMDSALFQFTPSLLDSAQSLFNHCPSLLADFSLDDFLFTEIDNLLFDNTPCSSSPSPSSGSSKVISMTFKSDLNELDHIMEVLVGS